MTELAKLAHEMHIAYIDWMDNTASTYFMDKFFEAQDAYNKAKEEQDD